MRKIFAILLLLIPLCSRAQDSRYPQWTAAEAQKANTCQGVQDMSEQEREIVYLMNLARTNGTKFWNTYLADELKGKSGSYISSLKSDLAKVKDLPMLYPDAGLIKAAKYHASDMAKNNFFDHASHDGTSCFNRIKRYYSSGNCAENISAGMTTAIAVVAQLLVDDGLPSLGHRKTILNKTYNAVGVACGTHSRYTCCCVQDFGDRVLSKPSSSNGGGSGQADNGGRDSYNNGGRNSHHGGRNSHHGGGNVHHGGNGRDNHGGRGSSYARPQSPRFPDPDDDAWEYDDEDEYWYIEDGDYLFMWFDDDDIPAIYYDYRTEKFYGWDDDTERWEEIELDD